MSLRQGLHEPILKEDLRCWRCRETFNTLPKLKEHLKREKDAEASREKMIRREKKGKNLEEGDIDEADPGKGEPSSKRRQAITLSVNT